MEARQNKRNPQKPFHPARGGKADGRLKRNKVPILAQVEQSE
jgi:hypothetical protein